MNSIEIISMQNYSGAGNTDQINNNSTVESDPVQTQTMDREMFGAQVVSKTLDYMNAGTYNSSGNMDYDFQKSVLGAAYSGVGSILNVLA